MKNSITKKLVILSAVSAVFAANVSLVFAAPEVRPMPGTQSNTVTSSGTSASDETSVGNYKASDSSSDSSSSNSSSSDSSSSNSSSSDSSSSDSSSDSSEDTNVKREAPTPVPVEGSGQVNIVTDNEKAPSEKKSVSAGTMILWLLLSVIINAAISFWISNRFYRLSKKDTHITSEIRALRRDVEEKFLQSVGGFAEQATDIENSNDDFSVNGEGITMPRRRQSEQPSAAEEDEMFKKWENRQSSRAQASNRAESGFESNRRKKYQPVREETAPDFEDDEDDGEDTENKSGIKSKAKELLNDIFPFKED